MEYGHHYGNQSLVRRTLVEDAIKAKEQSKANAITEYHPAFKELVRLEELMTVAEVRLLNKVMPGSALN